jgi:hypothetical protein
MKTCPNCGALADGVAICSCGATLQSAERARRERVERIVLVVASVYLIFSLLLSLGRGPEERVGRRLELMEVGLLLLQIFAVIALGIRVAKAQSGSSSRGGWIALSIAGTAAGLVLLGSRMSKDDHPGYSQTLPRENPQGPLLVAPRLEAVVEPPYLALRREADAAATKFKEAKWPRFFASKDPALVSSLTIADLREFRATVTRMIEASQKMEATLENPATVIPASEQTVETHPETWRASRALFEPLRQGLDVIDEHWAEWEAHGLDPVNGERLAWQNEVLRLSGEVHKARERAREIGKQHAQRSTPATSANQPSDGRQKAADRVSALKEKTNEIHRQLMATPWAKTVKADLFEGIHIHQFAAVTKYAVPKLQKLARKDLQDFHELQKQLIASIDGILATIDEAGKNGEALSGTFPFRSGVMLPQTLRQVDPKPEHWRAARKVYAAAAEEVAFLDLHWDDWQKQGLTLEETKPKEWQREAARLQSAFKAALSDYEKL